MKKATGSIDLARHAARAVLWRLDVRLRAVLLSHWHSGRRHGSSTWIS
jgi:hypothetical protein